MSNTIYIDYVIGNGGGMTGATGSSGTSGTSGLSGTTGENGSSGTSGSSGLSGINGLTCKNYTLYAPGPLDSQYTATTCDNIEEIGNVAVGVSYTKCFINDSVTINNGGVITDNGICVGDNGTSGTSGTSGLSGATGNNGTSGTSGLSGTTGSSGTSGSSGAAGAVGGLFFYLFDTTKSTDTPPSASSFHCNNPGSQGSITKLWLDNEDYAGADISTFVSTLLNTNNSVKAYFTIRGSASTERLYMQVNSFTQKSGYYELDVTTISSTADQLDNNDICGFNFSINGLTGSTGSSGSSGTGGTSGTSGLSGTTGSSGSSGTSGLNGTSGVNGTVTITYINSQYQVLQSDLYILVDSSIGSVNVKLPHFDNPKEIYIKDYGGNATTFNVNISADSPATLESGAPSKINTNYGAVNFVYDNVNFTWRPVSQYP